MIPTLVAVCCGAGGRAGVTVLRSLQTSVTIRCPRAVGADQSQVESRGVSRIGTLALLVWNWHSGSHWHPCALVVWNSRIATLCPIGSRAPIGTLHEKARQVAGPLGFQESS